MFFYLFFYYIYNSKKVIHFYNIINQQNNYNITNFSSIRQHLLIQNYFKSKVNLFFLPLINLISIHVNLLENIALFIYCFEKTYNIFKLIIVLNWIMLNMVNS